MVFKQSAIVEAYEVLGLEQGASLELVKTTYKQLALKTHPDKNPDDEDATAQFQRLSEAYNTLLKYLDHSSAPPREHSHSHTHTYFHPFGYDDHDYGDDDDYYYDDEYYDEYESDYEEQKMNFYRYLFEEVLRGRGSRFAHSQYHHHHPHHHHHHDSPPETPEQYSERLRLQREAQEQAADRRIREEANRKANQERERERQRREAEQRQRAKASAKKAEAEVSRKTAEQKARTQQEQVQTVRSKVFEAARRKDGAAVKKGVYEDNVDASGGEVRKGSESFAKSTPVDQKETLLHVAAKHGDADLVQWLDSHGAEPDERNSKDLTAYHIALRHGYPEIVKHYYETYPPKDKDYAPVYRSPESQSNLSIALEAKEPEMVWLVLDKHLYDQDEFDDACKLVGSKKFKTSISSAVKYDEFVNLFATFGGYVASSSQPAADPTPSPQPNGRQHNGKVHHQGRPRPTVTTDNVRSHTASPVSAFSENLQNSIPGSPATNSPRGGRGQYSRRGSYRPHQHQQANPTSPNAEQPSPQSSNHQPDGQPQSPHRGRGRGRGRGQFRGRGRGRGRGEVPIGVASA